MKKSGIPVSYMKFNAKQKAPFIIYRGDGAKTFVADNKIYIHDNYYFMEYYFEEKDEEKEAQLEQLMIDNDIIWEKSADIFIPGENLYVIYYNLGGKQ